MFWLEDIFISNNISIPHFLANFIYIQSMYYQKMNTLVLKGPTNTGKSMLLQLLLHPMQPTTISRDKDRSSFHLDQLHNSTSIIFEEPTIENTSVGSWKLLMEGNTLQTDMKHSDKEDITRLPVVITTNNDLWMWTEECEREPLQQRYIQFDLTKKN
jgi:phage/plasmid-associated DNA primase